MRYALVALVCLVAVVSAQAEEQWYVLLNGEDRLGYLHTTTQEDGDRVTSTQQMKLAVGRAGATVEITVQSRFVETRAGEPVEARSELNMGGTPLVGQAVFTDTAIAYTVRQGDGAPSTVDMPLPEPGWLPPAALERHIADRLAAGDQEISVRTMDIAGGPQVVEMTMRRADGEEDVEVYGRTVPAVVWDAEVSMMPGVALREYVGLDGQRLKSTVELMPGLSLTVLLADRDLALSPLTPTEMIANTLVTPDRPIDDPRGLRRARYALRSVDGRAMALPDVAAQSVTRRGPGAVEVAIDLDAAPGAAEAPGAELLAASPMLNHADPDIARLGARWSAAATDRDGDGAVGDAERAEALRAAVHGFIQQKDLSVGFASAGDVARTAQGDCTEHAVLLAAVLRGAGVPARCVSGLVYADQFAGRQGVFGYHMWTQAWLDPDGAGPRAAQWTDFDATLPGVAYDATHITLGVSDLNQGVMDNDMAAMLPLLGNLEIEVLEASAPRRGQP